MRHFAAALVLLLCTVTSGLALDAPHPTYEHVSMKYDTGNDKRIDPLTGDYLNQRGLFLRVEKRAFDAWPLVMRFVRDLPPKVADPALRNSLQRNVNTLLKSQMDMSGGFPMVFGEIHFENACQSIGCANDDDSRTTSKTGVWSFGPDYDWIGNVKGGLTDLRNFLISWSKKVKFAVPNDVLVIMDLRQSANGVLLEGNLSFTKMTQLDGPCLANKRCKGGNKGCNSDNDCKLNTAKKDEGVLNTKLPCAPLTAYQFDKLTDLIAIHHLNGEHFKSYGVPRPGGAQELKNAISLFEQSASTYEQQALFTIPEFPQGIDMKRPIWQIDLLEDYVDEHMHGWGDALTKCYQNPSLHRARAWTHGILHLRGHILLANYFGDNAMLLRTNCQDEKVADCPNLPLVH